MMYLSYTSSILSYSWKYFFENYLSNSIDCFVPRHNEHNLDTSEKPKPTIKFYYKKSPGINRGFTVSLCENSLLVKQVPDTNLHLPAAENAGRVSRTVYIRNLVGRILLCKGIAGCFTISSQAFVTEEVAD